jgi:TonB family protein
VRNLLTFLLLSAAIVSGQQTPGSAAGILAKYPAILNQQLGPSCELIRAVTLIEYKTYEALAFEGSDAEVYSPELGKADFVELSTAVPKKVAKMTKKSGFDVRDQSSNASGSTAESTTKGSSCPNLDQAVAVANQQRHERRVEVQQRIYKLDGRDSRITPPSPIRETQPESGANSGSTTSGGKPKVKHGMVTVVIAVDLEGNVSDAKVARSLDPVLDQKALEVVRHWEFSPARMNGLPIVVQVTVEVNFNLS